MGHLIISKKSGGKNIITYISNSLIMEYYFQRNVIVHFRNGRTTALKWRTSRMHRIKIMDFTDENVSIFFYQEYILVCKIHNFYPMHT